MVWQPNYLFGRWGNWEVTAARLLGHGHILSQFGVNLRLAHIGLIQDHRSDASTRRSAILTKDLRRLTMILKRELHTVIEKRTYLKTFCAKCPR